MLGNRELVKSEHFLKHNSPVKCFKVVSMPPFPRGTCPMQRRISVCIYIHTTRVVNWGAATPFPYKPLIKNAFWVKSKFVCSPFLYLSRNKGIQSFLLFLLSCSCSLGRLLSDGRLDPPCCLASSKNLSKPKGSSSN